MARNNEIVTQKKYVDDIIACYITIGNCLEGMNNYDKALDYYNKALVKLEDLKQLPQYFNLKNQTHNYIAKIYQKQNNTKIGKLFKESFRDIIGARFLAKQLAVRDIKAQYRQSYLGIIWAFVTPLTTAFVWIFLNGHYNQQPTYKRN